MEDRKLKQERKTVTRYEGFCLLPFTVQAVWCRLRPERCPFPPQDCVWTQGTATQHGNTGTWGSALTYLLFPLHFRPQLLPFFICREQASPRHSPTYRLIHWLLSRHCLSLPLLINLLNSDLFCLISVFMALDTVVFMLIESKYLTFHFPKLLLEVYQNNFKHNTIP